MNYFEQLASGVTMTINKLIHNRQYYEKEPEDLRKEVEAIGDRVAVLLHQQYKKGRKDALEDVFNEVTKKSVGGNK